jgi:hypothetical protein
MLLAIDPGPERSAWLVCEDGMPTEFGIDPNGVVLAILGESTADDLAVEMIASYGMPVGAEIFETCVFIGRLLQLWDDTHDGATSLVYRKDVKLHLCGSPRARDANVRQALIDRYGPGKETAIGRKATPGPLYGVTSHVWSALAVAVYAADTSPVDTVAERERT